MTQVHTKVRKVEVTDREAGQRIDNFLLKHLPGMPKSAVYRILRKGEVRINGGRAKPERKLALGDEVRIPPVRIAEKGEVVRPPDAVLNRLRDSIIYEDDLYLAINKPAGFASHGGTGIPYGVIETARAWGKYDFIELCHRLDRDTSGVLLLAKTRPGLLRAQRAFKNSLADKRYFALVVGRWRGEDRDVDEALVLNRLRSGERYVEVASATRGREAARGPGERGRGRHRAAPRDTEKSSGRGRFSDEQLAELMSERGSEDDGKPSKSRFSPRARYKDYTLMEVCIFSGRTHQIRVHSLALGHAVAGDEKYGERETNQKLRRAGLKRMFLHSHYLELTSEAELPKVIISAPMPDELRSFLSKLGPGR